MIFWIHQDLWRSLKNTSSVGRNLKRLDLRDWCFFSNDNNSDVTQRLVIIFASDTTIIRHVKVRADANPYDTELKEYFRKRYLTRVYQRNSMKVNGRATKKMAFERRESYEKKLSRTAPWGAETGNSFSLLGIPKSVSKISCAGLSVITVKNFMNSSLALASLSSSIRLRKRVLSEGPLAVVLSRGQHRIRILKHVKDLLFV